MNLAAHVEAGDTPGSCTLVGVATIVVSGKLAQFGSRLLVPVSDAMLAQFADNFRIAAAAVPLVASAVAGDSSAALAAPSAPGSVPARPAEVKELNALALIWTVFKGWLAGLFGKRS